VAITGAAGRIGSVLNVRLDRSRFDVLLVDERPVLPTHPSDRVALVDLRDLEATVSALAEVDAIVHLAAIPAEAPFDELLDANLRSTRHVYEAARHGSAQRVVFASSVHVSGFQPWAHVTSPADPPRPDTYYGLTKLAGEGLGRLYADRFGLQVVNLRIAAFGAEPTVPYSRWGWLSHGDLVRLVTAALTAPDIDYLTCYGTSANTHLFHTMQGWAELGYRPRDDAERFADRWTDVGDPPDEYQGGGFTDPDYFGDLPLDRPVR
jgi:uronate dehydrogenase